MFSSPLLSSLFKSTGLNSANRSQPQHMVLYQGQVLRGEILRILPNQTAVVQMGPMKWRAQLEAPLKLGQRSWFQVMSVNDPIILKVIPTPSGSGQAEQAKDMTTLIRYFGLPESKWSEETIRYFVKQKLPMNPSVLQQVRHLLSNLGHPQQTLPSIQIALQRSLPLTEETVLAVRSFLFGPPFSKQLEQLRALLTPAQRQRIQLADNFKQLKHQLQQLLQDPFLSRQARPIAEALGQHIAGQQLFLQLETSPSPFYQLFLQFFVPNGQRADDFYGQMEGKKTSTGRIDPDNCRMIFYVDLPYLGETCLDIHIVDKRISVTIYNANKIQNWLTKLKPALSENLKALGYHLSTLTVKNTEERHQPMRLPSSSMTYQGVDMRI